MRYKIINKKKLYATALADLIGSIVFLPKTLLRKNEKISPEDIKSILVIRTAYIGDIIMTLPMLRPLRERFGSAKISFLTSAGAADLITNNPYIDEVIAYDPFWFYPSAKNKYLEFIRHFRKKIFDMIIETRGDIRELLFLVQPLKARFKVSYDVGGGGYLLTDVVPYKELKHKVEYHLDIAKYLGCKTNGIEWGIYLTNDEKKKAEDLLKKEGVDFSKPIAALHPGARKDLKCWSSENYAKVADSIMDEFDCNVLFMSAFEEVPLVKKVEGMMKNKPIVLAGKTTIREFAGIISYCSLFICNDSAPMHISAAMKTPTVAIFGPSKSKETGPYGNIHRVVEKDFPCRYTCDEDVCHFNRHHACMEDISAEDVIFGVRKIWITKPLTCI